MKKLISLGAGLMVAVSAMATGSYQINAPQSGVINFTGTNQIQTISFSPAFTAVPVLQLFGSATNASPITNSVTATNFTVSVASTNVSVAWNAYQGYPRMQYGTNTLVGGTPLTNTFAVPYAYAPVLSVEGSTTNGIGITSVSATGFVLSSAASQGVSWVAVGPAYTAGSQTVTY